MTDDDLARAVTQAAAEAGQLAWDKTPPMMSQAAAVELRVKAEVAAAFRDLDERGYWLCDENGDSMSLDALADRVEGLDGNHG